MGRGPGPYGAPLTSEELFRHASGVTDFGTVPGLVSHQSTGAWAGAVTKPGFVKFAWQPAHDDWLFKLSGANPMFLPSTAAQVTGRQVRTYSTVRDGFDGSATLLRLGTGRAGLTTLPSGAVVYATTGVAAGRGTWRSTTSRCRAWRASPAHAPTASPRAAPP